MLSYVIFTSTLGGGQGHSHYNDFRDMGGSGKRKERRKEENGPQAVRGKPRPLRLME